MWQKHLDFLLRRYRHVHTCPMEIVHWTLSKQIQRDMTDHIETLSLLLVENICFSKKYPGAAYFPCTHFLVHFGVVVAAGGAQVVVAPGDTSQALHLAGLLLDCAVFYTDCG